MTSKRQKNKEKNAITGTDNREVNHGFDRR